MTAEITNSNMLGLADIINKDNIQQDKLNAIDDIAASVVPPSDYSEFKSLLFSSSGGGESSYESDITSSDDRPVVKGKARTPVDEATESESYYSEEDEGSYTKSDSAGSYSSSIDIDIKDPLNTKNIKGVVNLTPSANSKVSGGKDKEAHSKMLNEIDSLRSVLSKRGIPMPHYKPKDIKRNRNYAKEILNLMKNLESDNKTADDMTHVLRFALNILCKTFNGRHELFGYKIDLRGYKTLVMSDIKDIREDTVEFASFVRKKLGVSTMKIFLIFRIFILNAGITIIKNNDSGNTVDVFDDEEDYSSEDISSDAESVEEEEEEESMSQSE